MVAPDMAVARVAVTVEAVGRVVLHLHHAAAQRAGGEVAQRVIGVGPRAPGAGGGGEAAKLVTMVSHWAGSKTEANKAALRRIL